MRRFLFVLAAAAATATFAKDFTQADLERIGREIEAVAAKDPMLTYPVKYELLSVEKKNAFATWEKDGDNRRAYVGFTKPLVEYLNGEERLIRAVLCHEFTHLGSGHCSGPALKADDLNNLFTRQQEMEADLGGTKLLIRLGHPKQDMIDMLLRLEEMRKREGQWFEHLTGDHPNPKERAAEISDNPSILRALLQFDAGLMFMDSRRWFLAGQLFDDAAAREPKLVEAYVNAGYSALMFYYDQLPGEVREAWYRPDFGPVLMNTQVKARGVSVTDQDVQRWNYAISKLKTAVEKAGSDRAKELLALAQALEPNGDKATVEQGTSALKALLDGCKDEWDRLRLATNYFVGCARLNRLQAGYDAMVLAQKGTTFFNYALGENLGRVRVNGRSGDLEKVAANVLYTWLTRSPSNSPYWKTVREGYELSCKALSAQPMDTKAPAAFLCRVVSIWFGGHEFALLSPSADFEKHLGAPELTLQLVKKYPDMTEVRWKGGAIVAVTERGKMMRITTTDPTAGLFLIPTDLAIQSAVKLNVGMSEAEFKKTLDPASGVPMNLGNRGKAEEWKYWPALGLGVLFADGKVAALTVTPIDWDRLPE